jgi:hypothetical protein
MNSAGDRVDITREVHDQRQKIEQEDGEGREDLEPGKITPRMPQPRRCVVWIFLFLLSLKLSPPHLDL